MALIANLTAKEYFVDEGQNEAILKELLTKNKAGIGLEGALTKDDLSESRWKRTDKIVKVDTPSLGLFVRSQFSRVIV